MIGADIIQINLITFLVLVLASSLLLLLAIFTFIILLRASSRYRKSFQDWIAEIEKKKERLIQEIEKKKDEKSQSNIDWKVNAKKKERRNLFRITNKLRKKRPPEKIEPPEPQPVQIVEEKMELSEEEELEMLVAAVLAIHIEMHLHQQPAVLTQLDFANSVNSWAFASRPVVNSYFKNLTQTSSGS